VTTLKALQDWIDETARLTRPDQIRWCNGSDDEYRNLTRLLLDTGGFIELNQETHPGCYLHRSDVADVARVEHLTFVCTAREEEAGPNNNWMAPADARARMRALFEGCMSGRTLYVIPYCMGPIDSPLSRCGVEITDSPYVAVNMHLMTRMGDAALRRIEREGTFVKGLHSIGQLDPDHRFIMHFPEDLEIQSFGSGYGGNALLGKKCHALRIASFQARAEGWLAEHMLILGVQNPQGEVYYIAAAFPSACGKTNLAMMIPPAHYEGWKIWTLGDDICWMRLGADGRMWAINPEAGFFGVAPGTAKRTNPNALAMLDHDAIFTNVAVTEDMQPWWEGLDDRIPAEDWTGEPYEPRRIGGPAAHPNSRFTVRMSQCPSYSDQAEAAEGVPISAIVFGGRRAGLVPLVMESETWTHGVLMGASMASETTAAATDAVGVVRRDPMAMKPFCGYNFADYWAHWLSFEGASDRLPRIFNVNWFRKNERHRFMWPGFGENMRVLEWVVRRCQGDLDAVESPIGRLPAPGDLNLEGINVDAATVERLLAVDVDGWKAELAEVGDYLDSYGSRTPASLKAEWERVAAALNRA
jgi:phosphoenolpyruvate carboxykinase (GTP)